MSKNKDVRAFAEQMVKDHEAVNKQALALCKKLNVTPEDNDTSKSLAAAAKAKRDRAREARGAAFDKAYIDNEVAYHKTVNGALADDADSVGAERASSSRCSQTGLKIFQGHQQHAEMARVEDQVAPPSPNPRGDRDAAEQDGSTRHRCRIRVGVLFGARGLPEEIVVDNFEYQPASLTVSVGDTVEWDNKDGVDHSATSQTGGFDVALPAGKSGTFVAKTPGTFDYICTLHPNMKATLTVAAR